ncbi:MAG: tail fiber protein [Croceitalea sp.]|nr:tail fiber protein [Croceitalea sp.]
MDPILGQIQAFGFNFAPAGWAQCNGQLLSIAQNTALFSLLGTIYGGDGETTFALPDLRGRASLHVGTGPGLTTRPIGQRSGQETHTLTTQQMPNHNHSVSLASNSSAGGESIATGIIASHPGAFSEEGNGAVLGGLTQQNAGGSQSHNNMQPYIVINYCIALVGIFPSQN